MGFSWLGGLGRVVPAPAVATAPPVMATAPPPRTDYKPTAIAPPKRVAPLPGLLPRGIRNNNPLNIEHHDYNKWVGLDTPPSDGRFCRFTTMEYGVRAAALLLFRHWNGGRRTIRQIVLVWAPAVENDVDAYALSVAAYMHAPYDVRLDLDDRQQLELLIAAMANHENGREIAPTTIALGVTMALGASIA